MFRKSFSIHFPLKLYALVVVNTKNPPALYYKTPRFVLKPPPFCSKKPAALY